MGVEDIILIPAVFDLPHQFVGLFAVLQGDELTSQPAVPMFATDSTSVFAHKEGRLVCDRSEELFAFLGLEV